MASRCVKCNEEVAIILLGTNGTFCKGCFDKYFVHKFRASLGMNPVVRHGDKVAVAYSGGNSSSAMLHVILQSISPTSFKKLKFEPSVIFIDESSICPDDKYESRFTKVKGILKDSKLEFHVVKFEKVFEIGRVAESEEEIPTSYTSLKDFFSRFKSLTSRDELLYRLRNKLLAYEAEKLGCKHVFLGETSTRLAINILSNLSLGRGAQLASDTRFNDEGRYFGINLLRPMRGIGAKEIVVYNNLHKTPVVFFPNFSTKTPSNASIQRLTEDFVTALSADFPSTETTVFRTSNKLEVIKLDENTKGNITTCQLCHGKLDTLKTSSSALKAIDFTENLSLGMYGTPEKPDYDYLKNLTGNDDSMTLDGMNTSRFCHCCDLIAKDLPADQHNRQLFEYMTAPRTADLTENTHNFNSLSLDNH